MLNFKKNLKQLYKKFIQKIFKYIYGSIQLNLDNKIKNLSIKKIKIDDIEYKIFKTKNCRLYTTSVHDQAVIIENKLIEGPSFQLRIRENDKSYARNNGKIKDNVVLKIGTPRLKKNIKGKVFSLLSGGAAKTNYFHWLFEILPKLEILNKLVKLNEIDFFLVPSIKMKHHLETFEILNIEKKKLLDSNSFKHISCDELYVVEHPFRLTNNTIKDTQNIPSWIFNWIRNRFLHYKSSKLFPEKIFIERAESISKARDIKNKNEVYKILKNNGYTFLRPEEFNFKEQIQMFFSAKKIIGLHGAAFANICFCNPNTDIIEFKTVSTGMNSGNIALKSKLNYYGIICEATDKLGQQGKLIVPINKLKSII